METFLTAMAASGLCGCLVVMVKLNKPRRRGRARPGPRILTGNDRSGFRVYKALT